MASPTTAHTGPPLRDGFFLSLVTVLAYVQSLTFPFLRFDDITFILNNPRAQTWAAVPSFFTGATSGGASDPTTAVPGFYRPLQGCWTVLNYKVLGQHPALWHTMAIMSYVLSVWLLWRLIAKLTKSDFVALVAALLYALHPMHVEGVAWISGGNVEPLVSALFFAAFLAYLRWREEGRPRWLALCGILTLLALFSKETAAALPVLIVVHALIYRSRDDEAGARWERFAILTLTMGMTLAVYTVMRFSAKGALVTSEPLHSWHEVLLSMPVMFVTYLKHALWPVHLGNWYDTPMVTAASGRRFFLPLAILLVYMGVTVWALLRRLPAGFFLLWWLVPLSLPLVGMRQFNEYEIFHDRYAFINLAGLCVLAATILDSLPRTKLTLFGFKAISAAAAAGLVTILGVLTSLQVPGWSSDKAMYEQAVRGCPTCIRPQMLLATWYVGHGDVLQGLAMEREAMQALPNRWEPPFVYGVTLGMIGDRANALRSMNRASAMAPAETSIYLGIADLMTKGGDLDGAVQVLQHGMRVAANPKLLQQRLSQIQAFRQRSTSP